MNHPRSPNCGIRQLWPISKGPTADPAVLTRNGRGRLLLHTHPPQIDVGAVGADRFVIKPRQSGVGLCAHWSRLVHPPQRSVGTHIEVSELRGELWLSRAPPRRGMGTPRPKWSVVLRLHLWPFCGSLAFIPLIGFTGFAASLWPSCALWLVSLHSSSHWVHSCGAAHAPIMIEATLCSYGFTLVVLPMLP